MADINTITEIINNVGFPIAVCVALFYQNMKTNETFNKLQETLYQNTAVTQNNTAITQRLEDTIRQITKEGDK